MSQLSIDADKMLQNAESKVPIVMWLNLDLLPLTVAAAHVVLSNNTSWLK